MTNKEQATARVNAAITPSTKQLLEDQAAAAGRSVASQLSWLITQEAARNAPVDQPLYGTAADALRDELRLLRAAMTDGFNGLAAALGAPGQQAAK